jgi:aminodeoxyfutalosine deaminase
MVPATESSQAPWTLSARWIFPVSSPPLADGIITIAGERIVSVEPRGRRTADLDLGEAAILPGLVNAHTHLDLSGLRGRCPPSSDFTGWLRQVIAHRRGTTAQQIEADVRAGLAESLRHGTTLLGDISARGLSCSPVLRNAPLRSVVFYELIGLRQDRANEALEAAQDWLMRFIVPANSASRICLPGLSPHAPYSVRSKLFAQAGLLARLTNCPLTIHLAESLAELELLHHRRGPFLEFLKELQAWDPEGLATSAEEVVSSCGESVPCLFIHGNYLPPSACISRSSTIVYCPRTHAAFGHPPHPFREFLARGIRVALGTDSLASNPDLSVLAEMRHVHRHYPDVPGDVLLRLATLSGAEALGWAEETGSLEVGKSADLVAVPLAPGTEYDPYSRLLDSNLPAERVLYRGGWRDSPP